jgi:hypothetical protein
VLVAGAVIAASATADASLPASADPVSVTQGNVHSGIDGHVHTAASIAGNIKSAATGTPIYGSVTVYKNGNYVRSGITNPSTGHYEVGGLFAGSYAVCMSGFSVFTSNATGYLGRCYKTAPFNGTVPATATLVTVAAGVQQLGISFKLPNAAAISGRVTNPGGTGLANVGVIAHNRSSGTNVFSNTNSTGHYVVKGLTPAAKGYTVCFNPLGSNVGTGYRPRCYRNTAWSGGTSFPTSANAVGVVLGHVHTGINQTLLRGGAISGKVTDGGNGNPIPGESIAVFTAGGRLVGGASTNPQGNYVARGLAASTGYRVCARPISPTAAVTYHGKCWRAIAWNGGSLPAGTTPVGVQAGSTHTGINFRLSKTIHSLGAIGGQITASAGGLPLQNASVTLFRGGHFVNTTSTDSSGNYKFSGLPPSTSYVVCAKANFVFNPTPPATGWAPRCHLDAPWNGLGVPSSATRISLTAGQLKGGKNIALHAGGEIDGTIFVSGGVTPALNGLNVLVYTLGGRQVASSFSNNIDGTYSVKNLSPANYIVCFDGRFQFGSGFLPQCYNNAAWNGSP